MSKLKKIFLSKKSVVITIGLFVLVLGGGYFYNKANNTNKSNTGAVTREREYKVKKGDIVAGTSGTGKIVFKQVVQNFDQSVKLEEVFVNVGQNIHEGDKIASVEVGYIEDRLKQLNDKLNVENDQNEKNKINKQISYYKELKEAPVLIANTSGIVFTLGFEKGQTTLEGTPMITIADNKKALAEIPVSENNILDVKEGQAVYAMLPANEDKKFSGKVNFISNKSNSQGSGATYNVTIEFDNGEDAVFDGMTVNAQFIVKEKKDILELSNRAITLKDGKQLVKVKQKDGVLKETEITTGFSDGKNSEILSGLNEGDIVIVGGK